MHEDITVTIKFYANLREFGPKKSSVKVPYDSTITTILDKFNIPEEVRQLILLVNGVPHKKLDTILKDGDIVAVFPPIGGG